MSDKTPSRQRIRKWVLIGAIVLLLIPALQVALLWFANPVSTGPMVVRWCAGKFGSQQIAPCDYRWVSLKSVSPSFSVAVWQWEDRHFFEHWGFDWAEIQKARTEAKASGRPMRGASTITQQCARSLFLWQGRSWLRKGLEAYYTLWMELLLSKRRIFEIYVNVIEFGDGIYGVEAAAQRNYGVSAAALTKEQAALLVSVLPQPKVLDPRHPSESMLWRRSKILERCESVAFPIQN
jgi:monofunctional biosynthetic peptidoglycan transglycosylase